MNSSIRCVSLQLKIIHNSVNSKNVTKNFGEPPQPFTSLMLPAATFQRYKLIISYKGTNFNGVQRQKFQETNLKYLGHTSVLQVIDVGIGLSSLFSFD